MKMHNQIRLRELSKLSDPQNFCGIKSLQAIFAKSFGNILAIAKILACSVTSLHFQGEGHKQAEGVDVEGGRSAGRSVVGVSEIEGSQCVLAGQQQEVTCSRRKPLHLSEAQAQTVADDYPF